MLPPKMRRSALRSSAQRPNSSAGSRLRGISNAAFAPAKPADVKSFATAQEFFPPKMEQRLNALVESAVLHCIRVA